MGTWIKKYTLCEKEENQFLEMKNDFQSQLNISIEQYRKICVSGRYFNFLTSFCKIMSLLDIQCCGKSSSLFLRQKSDKKLARRIFSPIQQTDFEQQDQHEIANHYKDFKRKRVYKEHRRRQSYPAKYLGSRNKRLSLTSTREILQMPCFVFPR